MKEGLVQMNNQTIAANPKNETSILTATQLGWLVVETFGRLRRYEGPGRRPKRPEDDQTRPFAFSINKTMGLDELLWSINQLHDRVDELNKLELELPPPPLPLQADLERVLDNSLEVDALHGKLDDWSKEVWGLLNVENGVMGQAFVYGGSLANTYWYTTMVWSEDKIVADFLNPYRLNTIATHFEIIAEALPPYLVNVLGYSLRKWSDVNLNLVDKDQLKSQLESQQKVWRDLLFGRRSAESYLRARHYRDINAYSNGVQIGLALILVALVVIVGFEVGSVLEGSDTLSERLAALSGFVVLVGGLVTRFFSWVRISGDFAREKLKLRFILTNTYRDWKSSS